MRNMKRILFGTLLLALLFASGLVVSSTVLAAPCNPVDPDCEPRIPWPIAVRNDGNYPNYQLGDQATLNVFDPNKPNAPVYRHRLKDGVPDGTNVYIGHTDGNGQLTRSLPLNDPAICGTYTNERFSVGSPYSRKSNPALNYTVTCP